MKQFDEWWELALSEHLRMSRPTRFIEPVRDISEMAFQAGMLAAADMVEGASSDFSQFDQGLRRAGGIIRNACKDDRLSYMLCNFQDYGVSDV